MTLIVIFTAQQSSDALTRILGLKKGLKRLYVEEVKILMFFNFLFELQNAEKALIPLVKALAT